MLHVVDFTNRVRLHAVLRSMFAARKKVFIDLLKWDVPALAGEFEVDHFDTPQATYLVVADENDTHLASARLLETTEPGILDGLFAHLADEPLPRGDDVFEITRFCLSPDAGARRRREARDTLLIGLAEYAIANDIRTYTGVAELSWFRQVQSFGWACRALGAPRGEGDRALVALRIDIDDTTLAGMAAAGISSSAAIGSAPARAA